MVRKNISSVVVGLLMLRIPASRILLEKDCFLTFFVQRIGSDHMFNRSARSFTSGFVSNPF